MIAKRIITKVRSNVTPINFPTTSAQESTNGFIKVKITLVLINQVPLLYPTTEMQFINENALKETVVWKISEALPK